MLRSNLSTRPFYNERVVHLLIALGGVIVLAITLFNVAKVIELSRHNTELSRRIGHDRDEAARLTNDAAHIRGTLNQAELTVVALAAREANALIDQRTFSWTAFFNYLESTMPPDVMLSTVSPKVERGETQVTMVVLGRTAQDIDEFIEKLEATGAFEKILARQTDKTEDGLSRASLEAIYTPGQDDGRAEETAAPRAAKPADTAAPPAAGAAQPPSRKLADSSSRPGGGSAKAGVGRR